MKKIALLFIGAVVFQTAFAQRKIEGTWQGKLNVATTSLRLVVHIKNENGMYSATMDSPDQGAKGIAFNKTEVNGDSLFLELSAANAKLSGHFINDSVFNGRWMQGAASLSLDLKKLPAGETVAEAKRPQTPQPPFPYKS